MEPESFLPLITGAIGGAASAGVFKGPIQTLEDWWYINFGKNASEKANMLRAKQELNIQKMKEETLKQASIIQPENVQEPSLNILGPALEASRFYIEEEELRNMFAKLISSSMDSSQNMNIHPSFVEIIKQLSVLDAKILISFKNSGTHLVGELLLDNPNGYFTIVNYFYLHDTIEEYSILDISKSISNLMRLGLIKITNDTTSQKKDFLKNRSVINFVAATSNTDISELRIKYARLDITPFGNGFIRSCVYSPSA